MRLQVLGISNGLDVGPYWSAHTSMKSAARIWLAPGPTKLPQADMRRGLERAFTSSDSIERVLANLSSWDLKLLGIVQRLGPVTKTSILAADLLARGILNPADQKSWSRYDPPEIKVLKDLYEKMVLFSEMPLDRHYVTGPLRIAVHPLLRDAIPLAPPIPWPASESPATVEPAGKLSSGEVTLNCLRVLQGLREIKTWQLVKGDMLSVGARKRLRNLAALEPTEADPWIPPDPHLLYFALLQGLAQLNSSSTALNEQNIDKLAKLPPVEQAIFWVRAWLDVYLWQDGIGVVPDRDSYRETGRIDPFALRHAREILAWALCRVAHTSNPWLDLETFLLQLWETTLAVPIDFFRKAYTWQPVFQVPQQAGRDEKQQRSLEYWFSQEAVWVANAVMVTLVYLGLVERGLSPGDPPRHCFRFTDLGLAVFGAPDLTAPMVQKTEPFLTVLPNHDIIAYLDQADAAGMLLLSRIAAITSTGGGQAQTFALRRENVYEALESGVTLESIRTFLTQRGRTPIPDNVNRALGEWASKRDALTLRMDVTMALSNDVANLPRGVVSTRLLSEHAALCKPFMLTSTLAKPEGWSIVDHQQSLEKCGTADERGRITLTKPASIAQARLGWIAEQDGESWKLTADSLAGAKQRGISFERVLWWLQTLLKHPIPPLLQASLQNWTKAEPVYLKKVCLLKVENLQAYEAIRKSETCRPVIHAHIPPHWFVISNDQVAAARKLFRELGFSVLDSLTPPEKAPAEKASSKKDAPARKKKPAKRRSK